jgi:hypothetical protein
VKFFLILLAILWVLVTVGIWVSGVHVVSADFPFVVRGPAALDCYLLYVSAVVADIVACFLLMHVL